MNSKKTPAAIMELHISPRYYYTDRTLRFFRSENDFIRKTIKVPKMDIRSYGNELTAALDTSNPGKKYLRCSSADVVCSLNDNGVRLEI